MNKTILFLILGAFVIQIGNIRGKLIEWSAPKLTLEDLKSINLSIDEQRRILINYEFKICQAYTPCADSSTMENKSEVASICNDTIKHLKLIQTPNQLPINVIKNLKIYHQSMINASFKIKDSWDNLYKDGGSFWTYILNWEIDSCSLHSIPQKIYRLYDFQKITKTEIVTCKQFSSLYKKFSN